MKSIRIILPFFWLAIIFFSAVAQRSPSYFNYSNTSDLFISDDKVLSTVIDKDFFNSNISNATGIYLFIYYTIKIFIVSSNGTNHSNYTMSSVRHPTIHIPLANPVHLTNVTNSNMTAQNQTIPSEGNTPGNSSKHGHKHEKYGKNGKHGDRHRPWEGKHSKWQNNDNSSSWEGRYFVILNNSNFI